MSCISSSSLSILLIGERLNFFQPSRGIRQGDLFSPYICIFCMEYLACLIQEEVIAGNWHRFKSSKNGPTFTHIFFANDVILFAKVSKESCLAIKRVLNAFCNVFGQKINYFNYKILFSPCTAPRNIETVINELGILVSWSPHHHF